MQKILLLFNYLLACFIDVSGSTTDNDLQNYQNQYPGEDRVGLVKEKVVEIYVSGNGTLDITASYQENILYLNDNAKFYNDDEIGFSPTFSKITDIQAKARVPQKNRRKTTKIKDFPVIDELIPNIFYHDMKSYQIRFPNLKKGSKTIMLYDEIYKEPHFFGSFYFAEPFPIITSKLIIKCDKDVELGFKLFNTDNTELTFNKKEHWNKILYTWEMKNITGLTSRELSRIKHHAPHIIMYVKRYTYNGKRINFLSGVDALHNYYMKFINHMKEYKGPYIKDMVDSLTANTNDSLQIVKSIYQWVQQNIKYIAIEDSLGGFVPRDALTVYNRRYGDCKDMANLTATMLNYAGIPGYIAWIGTRSIPYSHKEVPSPFVDNHMICAYKLNNQYNYLDATGKYIPFGFPTPFIQTKEVLVHLGHESYLLDTINVIPYNNNTIFDSVSIKPIQNNKLVGTGTIRYTGYKKAELLSIVKNIEKKNKKRVFRALLQKGNNKFFLDSIYNISQSSESNTYSVDYDFRLEDYFSSTNNEIYINPHLSKNLEIERSLDTTSKSGDISLSYKYIINNTTHLELPEGYIADYIPEDYSFGNEDFGCNFAYKNNDHGVTTHYSFYINSLTLPFDKYRSWNNFIKHVKSAYREMIILKKPDKHKENNKMEH